MAQPLVAPDRLNCPKCGGSAEPFSLEPEVSPWFCRRCKGLWFGEGMLGRLMGTPLDLPHVGRSRARRSTALTCPVCPGLTLTEVAYDAGERAWVERCGGCSGVFVDPGELEALRGLAAISRTAAKPAPALAPESATTFTFDDWRIHAFALPFALLFAFLARPLYLPSLPLGYLRTCLHELGHAIGTWLGSRAALPTPAGLTISSPNRSFFVFACETFLLGVLFAAGRTGRSGYLCFLSAAYFAGLVFVTFATSAETQNVLRIFGGVAGEFTLGAFLVVSFYYRLPERCRWDFWRYLALVVGMYSLVTVSQDWSRFAADPSQLPWGSWIDEHNGDLGTLRDEFGWTGAQIVASCRRLGFLCWGVVLAHYLGFLLPGAHKKR